MRRDVRAMQQHLQTLAAGLRPRLDECADHAEEESVHRLRTGTRRVEAMVETLMDQARQSPAPSPDLERAASRWLKLLKRFRQPAGAVRDLDVHRQLLATLIEPKKKHREDHPLTADAGEESLVAAPGLLTAPEAALPASAVEQQADQLDAWLKHVRAHRAEELKQIVAKQKEKFAEREQAFHEALQTALQSAAAAASASPASTQRTRRQPGASHAARAALDAFAALSSQFEQLNSATLHDFRKGAKKARYVAESGAQDAASATVARALKRLQDAIGDWHDWQVLADEARTALGDDGAELIAALDAKVSSRYTTALKTAARLRGQLLGERQALQQRSRPARPASTTLPR